MSYTELFKFNKKGEAEDLGEVHNAWRGAMAVWRILDKKYLPPFTPEWAKSIGETDREYSRASDMIAIKEIWGLQHNNDVSKSDKIVLGTTFDNVIVNKENMPLVISAFKEFEGETNLLEQAEILEEALKDEDVIAVAWNQTSVCGDNWTNIGGYDEDEDEYVPYNILTQDKHWELFQEDEEEVNE